MFAFDTEEIDRMLFDDASGNVKTAIGIINKDITQLLCGELGSSPLDL